MAFFSKKNLSAFYRDPKWAIADLNRKVKRRATALAEKEMRRLLGKFYGRGPHHNVWSHGCNPESKFFLEMQSLPNPRVLEIVSRRIAAPLDKSKLGPAPDYVGLDIQEGSNVDVVGDAHNHPVFFPTIILTGSIRQPSSSILQCRGKSCAKSTAS